MQLAISLAYTTKSGSSCYLRIYIVTEAAEYFLKVRDLDPLLFEPDLEVDVYPRIAITSELKPGAIHYSYRQINQEEANKIKRKTSTIRDGTKALIVNKSTEDLIRANNQIIENL